MPRIVFVIGHFFTKNSNTITFKTKNVCPIFYCISEIYIKFSTFSWKKVTLIGYVFPILATAKNVVT